MLRRLSRSRIEKVQNYTCISFLPISYHEIINFYRKSVTFDILVLRWNHSIFRNGQKRSFNLLIRFSVLYSLRYRSSDVSKTSLILYWLFEENLADLCQEGFQSFSATYFFVTEAKNDHIMLKRVKILISKFANDWLDFKNFELLSQRH